KAARRTRAERRAAPKPARSPLGGRPPYPAAGGPTSTHHLHRVRIEDVGRRAVDEVDDVLERGAEVELVAVLLDIADVRRANRILQTQQRRALQDRLALEDVDR